jgi:hypothetical protein
MAAAPTREELERWRELEKQRLSFARQARDAKKAQEQLEVRFLPSSKPKPARNAARRGSVSRCGSKTKRST